MMHNQTEILSDIKSAVQSVDATAEVVLFGSRARGDAREDSDWDLLVLVNKEQITMDDELKFQRLLLEVELSYSIAISLLVINKHKWNTDYQGYPLQIEIEKNKILL